MNQAVILLGSTGETGKRILSELIANNLVSEIHLLNRRFQGIQHHKVTEHIIDFRKPETFPDLDNCTATICTLGTTIKKAGSKQAFEQVDLHHAMAGANWAKTRCKHFVLVSSFGANANSNNFYLKTKGKLENTLKDMQWPQLSIFRPGLLLGKRIEFRLLERLTGYLMAALNPIMIGPLSALKATPMDSLAKAINQVASSTNLAELSTSQLNPKVAIYTNPEIEKLAQQD